MQRPAKQYRRQIDWAARKKSGERNRRFLEFVKELINDPSFFDTVPNDTLNLMEEFIQNSSGHFRIVVYHNFKELVQEQPDLFDSRIKQLLSFG